MHKNPIVVPFGDGKISLGVYKRKGTNEAIVLIERLKEPQEVFSGVDDNNIDTDKLPIALKFNSKDGLKSLYSVLEVVEQVLDGES